MLSDAGTRAHDIPLDVLAVLGLPPFDELTADRVRVPSACGVMNSRPTPRSTSASRPAPRHWWPRACRKHAGERAHRGLFVHASSCEQCVDAAEHCETSRALYRLVREGRR